MVVYVVNSVEVSAKRPQEGKEKQNLRTEFFAIACLLVMRILRGTLV